MASKRKTARKIASRSKVASRSKSSRARSKSKVARAGRTSNAPFSGKARADNLARATPATPPRPALPDHFHEVRRISTAFSHAVPQEALATGALDLERKREPAPVVPGLDLGRDPKGVPDGRYRVDGNDWIVTFKGGKVASFERGRPDTDPSDIIAVPSHNG